MPSPLALRRICVFPASTLLLAAKGELTVLRSLSGHLVVNPASSSLSAVRVLESALLAKWMNSLKTMMRTGTILAPGWSACVV